MGGAIATDAPISNVPTSYTSGFRLFKCLFIFYGLPVPPFTPSRDSSLDWPNQIGTALFERMVPSTAGVNVSRSRFPSKLLLKIASFAIEDKIISSQIANEATLIRGGFGGETNEMCSTIIVLHISIAPPPKLLHSPPFTTGGEFTPG